MPLIQHIIKQLDGHFDEILIGANEPEKYSFTNLKVVQDIEKDKGPLLGIYSCLQQSENDINFITACDIPEMNIKLIKNMINLSVNFDIVMPVSGEEKYEPLYAVYRKTVLPKAQQILSSNGRRIIELLHGSRVKRIDFSDQKWYQNINVKDDYLEFIKDRDRNVI
jgi:molybdopterin-guanine dinucleotide biosynthesis protein A